MSVKSEILALEEDLRLAELGLDPGFFAEYLDDEMLMDGQRAKDKIVDAHQTGKGGKFTRVELSDFRIIEHENAAVVACKGTYEGPQWSGSLKFQRVWLKKAGKWKIISAALLK